MPPSSEQPSSYEHPFVDPALYPPEEASRKQSPRRKGQGKKGKKNDLVAEKAEEGNSSKTVAQPM